MQTVLKNLKIFIMNYFNLIFLFVTIIFPFVGGHYNGYYSAGNGGSHGIPTYQQSNPHPHVYSYRLPVHPCGYFGCPPITKPTQEPTDDPTTDPTDDPTTDAAVTDNDAITDGGITDNVATDAASTDASIIDETSTDETSTDTAITDGISTDETRTT